MASRFKKDSRAVIIVITALLFPVLLAFLALAVDIGKIYDLKRRTQNAANAGALGGAFEVYRIHAATDVDQAGHEDAIKNGFDNSDSNVTVTINYPYTWQGVSGYVEAIVTETVPTYFAGVFNQNDVIVRSRAVAGLGNYSSGCVIALDPSAQGALTIQGTADFDVNCEIEVPSDHPKGLRINGSPPCVNSSGMGVVGGYFTPGNNSCIDPPPVGGMMYDEDPMSKALYDGVLTEPDPVGMTCDYTNTNIGGGAVTLTPGYYCGTSFVDAVTGLTVYRPAIQITGGTVDFEAGVYYLDSGMSIGGGAVVTGDDVLFYNTNYVAAPSEYDYWDEISVTGNAVVTLSGYESSPYQGALIWEDSSAPTGNRTHLFGGTATLNFSGFIYAPNSEVAWRGTNDTTGWLMVVANTVELSGTPFGSGGSFGGGGGPALPFQTVTLVE